ncbi:hypothetical protein FAIPA1_280001 [Frankia sp. AiPs1]
MVEQRGRVETGGHGQRGLGGVRCLGQIPAADPLPVAATLLRDDYANAVPHNLADGFVVATFSALGEIDRDTVARVLLGWPNPPAQTRTPFLTAAATTEDAPSDGKAGHGTVGRLRLSPRVIFALKPDGTRAKTLDPGTCHFRPSKARQDDRSNLIMQVR